MVFHLHLIFGPMFAGKSTLLLSQFHRLSFRSSSLLVNSSLDTRCSDSVQTHNLTSSPAVKVRYLSDLLSLSSYQEAKVVAIDEAQFYPDLVKFVESQMKEDKTFVIAGLDSDYRQKRWRECEGFGDILELIQWADIVSCLNADCDHKDCKEKARWTIRKSEEGGIGGKDKYVAVCRIHLEKKISSV